MRAWVRGLAFAALSVVLRLIQGPMINIWTKHAMLINLSLGVISVLAAVAWGVLDGRDDAKANPDPDRRRDLAMTWLGAGLVAGLLSGAVVSALEYIDKALYVGGWFNELTSYAAFTTLWVFVPGVLGVVIGRALFDRGHTPEIHHHGLGAQQERANTDVFATVGAGAAEGSAGQTAAARPGSEASTSNLGVEDYPSGDESTAADSTWDDDSGRATTDVISTEGFSNQTHSSEDDDSGRATTDVISTEGFSTQADSTQGDSTEDDKGRGN